MTKVNVMELDNVERKIVTHLKMDGDDNTADISRLVKENRYHTYKHLKHLKEQGLVSTKKVKTLRYWHA